MDIGLRKFKSASLRLAEPSLPDYDWPSDYLDNIREIVDIKSENPRKGHATNLLINVCKEADVEGKVLMLQVQQFSDGMGTDQLQKWYERRDFQVIQYEPVLLMARQPQ